MRTLITLLAVVTLSGCTFGKAISAGRTLEKYAYMDENDTLIWNHKVDAECADKMLEMTVERGLEKVERETDGKPMPSEARAAWMVVSYTVDIIHEGVKMIEQHCLKPAPVVIYQGSRTIQQPAQPATHQPSHVIVSPAVVAPIYNTNTRRYE